MKTMTISFLTFLTLLGCSTVDYVKPYTPPLTCPNGQIEYCEGNSPTNLDCMCIQKNSFKY